MSACALPSEHDYIGLTKVSSMASLRTMTSHKLLPSSSLAIMETELRLGLPGSEFPDRKHHPVLAFASISAVGLVSRDEDTLSGISLSPTRKSGFWTKRGFSDAIDGFCGIKSQVCASREAIVEDEGSIELAKVKDCGNRHGAAAKAQVVGWPPIRSFRKNTTEFSLAKGGDDVEGKTGVAGCLYVKVSMDGAPYLQKVDLENYKTYAELLTALEQMFRCFIIASASRASKEHPGGEISSERWLADLVTSLEYVLTYEDKDGDWMLVGDVPWRMFVESCRRMRIMKGSEAIGLAPRSGTKRKNGDQSEHA